MFRVTCLVLLSSAALAQDGFQCAVTEERTGEQKACQFPFKMSGTTYTNCTTDTDPEGKLWCSTRVTASHFHVGNGNFWGYCPDDCFETEETEEDIAQDVENQIFDLELSGRQSLLGQRSCPCTSYSTCPPLVRLLERGSALPENHRTRNKILAFLKSIKCSDERRTLRCCYRTKPSSPSPTTTPRPSPTTTKSTTTTTPTTTSTTKRTRASKDGTWQPSPERKECGIRTFSLSALGGNDSTLGELPFMALLGFDVSGHLQYGCGGTLLNKFYVLTAAHCFLDAHRFPLKEIVLGELDVVTDPDCTRGNNFCAPLAQRLEPDEVTIHEGFETDNFKDDIALIRLKSPALLFQESGRSQSLVTPVCLPWKASDLNRNVEAESGEVLVAGWGKYTNNNAITSKNIKEHGASVRILQKLGVPLIARSECERTFRRKSFESEKQICAGGEKGKDSCNGDSGGPLVLKKTGANNPWFQIGIVSYGTTKCGLGVPGAYTRVTHYLPWIQKHMRA